MSHQPDGTATTSEPEIGHDVDGPGADDTTWTPLRRMTLAGSVLLVVLVAFEQIAVSTAMPTVARQLDGLAIYPVAFAVPLAIAVFAMVVAGVWADATGPRVVLLTGVALFVGGLVLAGSAHSMPVLIAGRAVQSLGGGLDTVALYVLVADAYPEALRPKVFVGTSAAWIAPSLFGPPIAGYLASNGAWRWVFWLAALLAVPALAMLVPVLRRLRPEAADRERAPGVRRRIVAAAGASLGAAAVSVAADRPFPVAAACVAGGLLLLVLAAPRLLPARTFRAERGLPAVIATRACLGAAFAGTDVYLPLMLTRQHGMTATAAGLVLTVGSMSWFLGAWISGHCATSAQQRRVVRIGLVLLTVGIGGTVSAAWPSTPGWLLYLAWLVGGSGIGLAYSPLTVLLMGMSAPREQGRNSAALQTGELLMTSVLLAVSAIAFGVLRQHSAIAAFVGGLLLAMASAAAGAVLSHRLEPAPNAGSGGLTPRARSTGELS